MQFASRSTTIKVNASLDKTLPLFTAKGERLWVNGWNPTIIYPDSGEATKGMVWTTDVDEQTEAVWATVDYDVVNHHALYVKFTPGQHVTQIDVQCDYDTEHTSLVRVSYTLTAFESEGYADIEKLTPEYYQHWISSWEKAINHYLAYGEMLPA